MFTAGLITLNSGDDPDENLRVILGYVRKAAQQGAQIVCTPEVSNCVSTSRKHQQKVLQTQDKDTTLKSLQEEALTLGIWLLIGSLALKSNSADGRFVNRSFLIAPDGSIHACYDKIHMFDVTLGADEVYKESDGYRPGDDAVIADTALGAFGMTVCYDLRFPTLYRKLAQAGAQIFTIPAAFSQTTGAAHWEVLLRARAIETGSIVIAPAQTGLHTSKGSKGRSTYGHSMVISPWGEILYDGEQSCGVGVVEIDLEDVEKARKAIPSLQHDRAFEVRK
ncbi:hypothetical protein EDD53_2447 [Pacificibacter maritimus]|uniref:CN hydrolase domain-containing protein n=1 Tax=Pacificibacter maritimus TaxID=762213 RepID=A0A3N4UHR2_9RHOB|nr:carbon-nitrogen hydrolase family protein [Pacificibacter maritimus]RPE64687.1 hypothetical protein EDD53_2447 [Pacificibacter maritimus]